MNHGLLHDTLFTSFVMIYYFVSVFNFFCNKYELFRYLPGLNLYRLSCLCFNFCHRLGYIIVNFSSIGPKSSENVFQGDVSANSTNIYFV